ncbi:hypothetical protein AT728_04090 [Streptomyces silvensis]|uniref:Uncharacterized protein n=1 Tax=Streptomyces silvensis TaxID=1765722 RepID=A0A0W7X9W5_9ACTN|nr:hypothetical protein AT728_04090 [Streptomyces silvensis]
MHLHCDALGATGEDDTADELSQDGVLLAHKQHRPFLDGADDKRFEVGAVRCGLDGRDPFECCLRGGLPLSNAVPGCFVLTGLELVRVHGPLSAEVHQGGIVLVHVRL